MSDDFDKPYRKLIAANDKIEDETLMQEYIHLYKQKFRGQPLFDVNRVHLAQIKHFRSLTKENAHALLNHYFTIKDPWFENQAYSIGCLISNLQKVSASFTQKTTVRKDTGKLMMEFGCDSCGIQFTMIEDLNADYSKIIRCEKCVKENRPVLKTTPEQRRASNLKLGTVTPEFPKNYFRKDCSSEDV